ncbi:MAG: CHRD domain-containing protein [Bacteroidota bacterium]
MKHSFSKMAGWGIPFFLIAGCLLFSSCTKSDVNVTADVAYTISGTANGSQATPSNNSGGSGNMSGTYYTQTKLMTYTATWANLTGAPVNGGLYIGAIGQAGSSFAAWTLGNNLSASGSVMLTATLNADQEAQLLAGKCYYLLSTTTYASGEVRGQITATKQ